MRVALLLLSVAVFSKAVMVEKPQEKAPMFGFKELVMPAHTDGLVFSQDFQHQHSEGVTFLKYDVEAADNVHFVHLSSSDAAVAAIDCSELYSQQDKQGLWAGTMVLQMVSEEAAAALVNAEWPVLLTGSQQWGCKNHKGKLSHILHHALGPASLLPGPEKNTVKLQVRPAQYHEVFKHADIHFVTEKFEEDQFMGVYSTDLPAQEWEEKTQQRNLLAGQKNRKKKVKGWFSSFIKDAWNTAKSVGSYVQKAVNTVATVAKVIATGDYDANKVLYAKKWVFNVDSSTNKIVKGNLTIDSAVACNNCGLLAQFSIEFYLKIQSYSLYDVRTVAKGSFSAIAGARMEWSAAWSKANVVDLYTVHMQPITFAIGPIPVIVQVDIPIQAGYELDVEANAVLEASMSAHGSFQYGIGYTANAGLHLINENDFDYSGGIYTVNGAAQASLTVYLLPVVNIGVDFIGNVNIGIKPFLESTIGISTRWTDPCAKIGAALAVNLGLQVTAGAELDIKLGSTTLLQKELYAGTVFSVKKPIMAGCLSLGSLNNFDGRNLTNFTGTNYVSDSHMVDLDSFPPFPDQIPTSPAELAKHKSSNKRPLIDRPSRFHEQNAGSASLQSARLAAVAVPGCSPGTSWLGQMTRGSGTNAECNRYPPYRAISFQSWDTTVLGNGPVINMIGSVNDANSDSPDNKTYACVHQQGWSASMYSSGDMLFSKDTSVEPYALCSDGSSDCSCTSQGTALPSSMYGTTTSDFSTITLQDTLLCTRTVLTRVKPGTTGEYYQDQYNKQLLKPLDGACGMGGGTPTPNPGGCCGGAMPASQCSLGSGQSCSFGCQCQSGACGQSLTCS